MRKIILLTLMLTALHVCGAYAQKIDEPAVKYTEEELEQRLIKGESIALADMLWAEGSDMPMSMALDEIDSAKYYDQLNDCEKAMYNNYAANAEAMKDGVRSVTAYVEVHTSGATAGNWNTKIEEATGLSLVKFFSRPVYVYFYMDHPEVFWVDFNKVSYTYSGLTISPDGSLVTLNAIMKLRDGNERYWPECYTSQAQVEADARAMENKVSEIVSALPKGASDFYKTKYFTEWLCQHNTYNPSISTGTRYMYIAPSALLYGSGSDKTKYPVCEGYAEAFKILCDRAGVESMCITSATHKWNAVKINDRFYFSDPTWCDTTGFSNKMQNYAYLLIGTEKMKALDSGTNHSISYQTPLEAPPIAQKMYIEDMGMPVYNSVYYYYKYMDMDNNSVIDLEDCCELLRQAAGIKPKTARDLNGDGKIDLKDSIKYNGLMFGKQLS